MDPRKHDPVTFAFAGEKAIAVITYLASKPEEVPGLDKYKVGKLIFLADKYHLVRYGRPIVGGEYRALKWGPIPQDALDLLQSLAGQWYARPQLVNALADHVEVTEQHRTYPRFRAKGRVPWDDLSESDLAALDHVINLHGKKSFDELKVLTHAMPAYGNAWDSRRDGTNFAQVRYEDFFEEDPDAIEGAYEEMTENDALRKAFPESEAV